MSEDLIVLPGTGEVLTRPGEPNLEVARDEDLVRLLYELKRYRNDIRYQLEVPISNELLARMDYARTQALTAPGGYRAKTQPPNALVLRWTRTENVDVLVRVLEELVADGLIPQSAADAAVQPTYKVSEAGVNALIAGGGEVAERVKACGVEGRRSVEVTKRSS